MHTYLHVSGYICREIKNEQGRLSAPCMAVSFSNGNAQTKRMREEQKEREEIEQKQKEKKEQQGSIVCSQPWCTAFFVSSFVAVFFVFVFVFVYNR